MLVHMAVVTLLGHLDAVDIDCPFHDDDVVAKSDGGKDVRPILQCSGVSVEVYLVQQKKTNEVNRCRNRARGAQ